ncbi:MAG: hypothetical protein J1F68_03720 [Clostridiales bacterium]|nr:hypothetical protein [Clostridiales bacterium]
MLKPLKLASHNWKVLLKSLMYQALLLALVIALGSMIFGNLFDELFRLIRENDIRDFLYNTVNSIFSAEFNSEQFAAELGEMIANMQQSISSVRVPWGGVTVAYVLFIVILVIYRLLVSLTDVACDCQLEEFMTANAERPFTWFFIKKQGRTWEFVLLQTALVLPLDILIVSGSVGFYLMFLIAFNWWTIIPVALIALVFYVIRQSLFAFCLPAVVCEDLPTRKAYTTGLSKIMTRFWQVFWKTLVVMCIMVAIAVVSLMFIENAIVSTIVLTVPNFILFFYLKCVYIVEYFKADNRPFFYKRVYIEGTDRHNRKLARQAKRANRKK